MKRKNGQFRPVNTGLSILLLAPMTLGDQGGWLLRPPWMDTQDSEDWHPGTLLGAGAFHTHPQPHCAAHHCQPGLGRKSHVLRMCRGLEGLGLTVGVLGLLLHLSVLRVLTAEKAQAAGVSSGTQGHLLSKYLSWPQGPAPHREWKPGGLSNTVPNHHGAGTISRQPVWKNMLSQLS